LLAPMVALLLAILLLLPGLLVTRHDVLATRAK
jgi:hypothetical protein